jgi:hypothetical protein
MVEKFSLDEMKRMANIKVQVLRNWNIGIMWSKKLSMRCHPEQGEGSLTCPPHSYGRRGFFTEFTLSRLFRFFTAFRMTFST